MTVSMPGLSLAVCIILACDAAECHQLPEGQTNAIGAFASGGMLLVTVAFCGPQFWEWEQ